MRDIHSAYFSLNDADDDEPADLPQFIITTQLGLPFAEFIERMVKAVYTSYIRLTTPAKPSTPMPPNVVHPTSQSVIDPALTANDRTAPSVAQPAQKRVHDGTESSPKKVKKARTDEDNVGVYASLE